MFFRKHKLGQKGFSHHLLLPVLVVGVVAAVGGYVISQSHAATPAIVLPSQATSSANIPAPNIINYPPTVKYGDSNHSVGAVQRILSDIGIANDDQKYKFGSSTLTSIKDLQTYFHLSVDGIVGHNTWNLLFKLESNVKSDHMHGATPQADFTIQNTYSGVYGNSILFTAKAIPTHCYSLSADNLSDLSFINRLGILGVVQKNGHITSNAAPGPNILAITDWCNLPISKPGALTFVVVNH